MFSTERIRRLAPGMVLDIDAELVYWKSCYPYRRFFHAYLPFAIYIPTFKFGYDTYLIHNHERLAELVPMLERRYTSLHESDQLPWTDAMAIVRAAWKRMGAESAVAPGACPPQRVARPSSTGSQLERSLQSQVDLLAVRCMNCPAAQRQATWDRGLLAVRAKAGTRRGCVELDDAIQDAGFRLGIFDFNAQAARFYGTAMG